MLLSLLFLTLEFSLSELLLSWESSESIATSLTWMASCSSIIEHDSLGYSDTLLFIDIDPKFKCWGSMFWVLTIVSLTDCELLRFCIYALFLYIKLIESIIMDDCCLVYELELILACYDDPLDSLSFLLSYFSLGIGGLKLLLTIVCPPIKD